MSKDYSSLEPLTEQPEFCEEPVYTHSPDGVAPDLNAPCGEEIKTMAYKGTGVCGEEHRKARNKRLGQPDERVTF